MTCVAHQRSRSCRRDTRSAALLQSQRWAPLKAKRDADIMAPHRAASAGVGGITMRSVFIGLLLVYGANIANAENVVCHPGAPDVKWEGHTWEIPAYFGPLSEVTISHNFGNEQVSCKRNAIEATTTVNGQCHFKAGSKVSVRRYLKMQWLVCETHKDDNIEECVVECDE